MMSDKLIRIGDKLVGSGQPVFVIAEAGINHNGNLDMALRLIDVVADAGADAVKFQTFRAEQAVSVQAPLCDYQKKSMGGQKSLLEEAKAWELKEEWYDRLIQHCWDRGVIFLSTPHGNFESIDFLKQCGVPAFKIASGELTNFPVIRYAAKLGKPIILSTGMATFDEVVEAVDVVRQGGNNQVIVLHCTTEYPCPLEYVNLSAITTMRKGLSALVGYSDHTLGDQVAVMAVTLGACMIEKHITLDKNSSGPDHKASLEPEELKTMIRKIRQASLILGSGQKVLQPVELKYLPICRRSIVAAVDIRKGEVFSTKNLTLKRPGTGMLPKMFDKVMGCKAACNIVCDTLIESQHVEGGVK